MNWQNVHVAITGASSGIGEALARELFASGARLTLVARREDRLRALAAEVGGAHVAVRDLSEPDQMTSWIAEAERALGPIEVVVNNAGAELTGCTDETSIADGEKLLRVNLNAPLRITHALLPAMLARGSGTIVDVSSVAALAPPRGYFWYAASKGGIAAASEALRGEIAHRGVHVVTVYPGPIHTYLGKAAADALEQTFWLKTAPFGTPEKLARLVRHAIERKRPRVIYPYLFALSRWVTPLARWVADLTAPPPLPKSHLPQNAVPKKLLPPE